MYRLFSLAVSSLILGLSSSTSAAGSQKDIPVLKVSETTGNARSLLSHWKQDGDSFWAVFITQWLDTSLLPETQFLEKYLEQKSQQVERRPRGAHRDLQLLHQQTNKAQGLTATPDNKDRMDSYEWSQL